MPVVCSVVISISHCFLLVSKEALNSSSFTLQSLADVKASFLFAFFLNYRLTRKRVYVLF